MAAPLQKTACTSQASSRRRTGWDCLRRSRSQSPTAGCTHGTTDPESNESGGPVPGLLATCLPALLFWRRQA
eukprot:4032583-Prymnesium_polylepis.1